MATVEEQLAARYRKYPQVLEAQTAVPDWVHPAYTGSDPAYQAWLAQADYQGKNALSQARLRKGQLDEAYKQALADLERESVTGRRNVQTNALQRGIFHSGENDRRKQEYDAQITQAQARAQQALVDQQGQVDQGLQSTYANLSTQGATNVSQAMLRDALAQYNATQAQSAQAQGAPAAPAQQAQAPYVQPQFSQTVPTGAHTISSPQQLSAASSAKPKAASGTTGKLKLSKSGLQ